jgi:hypothetical protein
MWLLSSVVLTGGAAWIQSIQHKHEVEQKNREQLSAHRFEVSHRSIRWNMACDGRRPLAMPRRRWTECSRASFR